MAATAAACSLRTSIKWHHLTAQFTERALFAARMHEQRPPPPPLSALPLPSRPAVYVAYVLLLFLLAAFRLLGTSRREMAAACRERDELRQQVLLLFRVGAVWTGLCWMR